MHTISLNLPASPSQPIGVDISGPMTHKATENIALAVSKTRFAIQTSADPDGEVRDYRATFDAATGVLELDSPALRLQLTPYGVGCLALICACHRDELEGFLASMFYLAINDLQNRPSLLSDFPSLDRLGEFAQAHMRYTREQRIERLRAQLSEVQRKRWAIEEQANSPASRRNRDRTIWVTPATPDFEALCVEENRLHREIVALMLHV